MEYDLYHDESREFGYWHGILLVPKTTRRNFLNYLELFRKNTGFKEHLKLKDLDHRGKKFRCVRAWITLGVGAFIQNFKGEKYHLYTGKFKEYQWLNQIIGAKFIVFSERDSHQKMDKTWFPDYAAKVETTFRMGLKGGLNLFSEEKTNICITSLHFHGYEHHSGRHIDQRRTINKIQGLQEYCSFISDIPVYDKSGNHTKKDCQEYEDCQFLQLTDLLIGSFRVILTNSGNKIQKEVAFPVSQIIDRWHKGYARMANSGWFRGFCISRCYLENGIWNFENNFENNNKQSELNLSI